MSDLTDRMRTCAAYLVAAEGEPALFSTALRDAADMLLEASNALEAVSEPLGEPMEILEPVKPLPKAATQDVRSVPKAVWYASGDFLPSASGMARPAKNPRACPQCDSRATKRVFRHENKLMLACPGCAAAWEYRP